MTRLSYSDGPSVAHLESQVRADIERLRRRINDEHAPVPLESRRRRTGRLYQVVTSCLGDAHIEG